MRLIKIVCRNKKYLHKVNCKQQGFTLLEIVVVVAIIGIVSVMFAIRLNHDADRSARLEVKRFINVLQEIRDESIITGKPFAMQVNDTSTGYEFLVYQDQEWISPKKNDRLFDLHLIEENVRMRFDVFELTENASSSLLQITPLGEISPFKMLFIGSNYHYDVNLDEEQNIQFNEIEVNE